MIMLLLGKSAALGETQEARAFLSQVQPPDSHPKTLTLQSPDSLA